jgi:excisionase family DNA binding protein
MNTTGIGLASAPVARVANVANVCAAVVEVRVAGHHLTAAQPRGMKARDPWMHTTEVADELGLSGETVRRLIRERRLRASAIGVGDRTTYRIRRSDLEHFRQAYVRDTTVDDWE